MGIAITVWSFWLVRCDLVPDVHAAHLTPLSEKLQMLGPLVVHCSGASGYLPLTGSVEVEQGMNNKHY